MTAILVAMYRKTIWCLFLWGSHNDRAICCRGIAQMCSCKTKYQEGIAPFGDLLTSLKKKYRANGVSQR